MAIESIDYDICMGCQDCVEVCPTDVLRWDDDNSIPKIVYPEDCQLCELCVIECPEDAITVTPEKQLRHTLSWG
jgi:NAD-dependent dihydropyrimidine dehydrogenase PreA subunit